MAGTHLWNFLMLWVVLKPAGPLQSKLWELLSAFLCGFHWINLILCTVWEAFQKKWSIELLSYPTTIIPWSDWLFARLFIKFAINMTINTFFQFIRGLSSLAFWLTRYWRPLSLCPFFCNLMFIFYIRVSLSSNVCAVFHYSVLLSINSDWQRVKGDG